VARRRAHRVTGPSLPRAHARVPVTRRVHYHRTMPARPALITFDVFGTILDWREGLRAALALRGVTLGAGDFDRVIDAQGSLEQVAPRTSYREIVARSLVEVLGLDGSEADAIGRSAGTWPPFLDSRPALLRLMARARCLAMTN
jgi:FMN phosphatase YigB (HAD superfamily)